ncbi:MAG: FeoB-associated Cys-rich membrane protein [Clostridia bacterium]|nr:FeoB-associated Cys-rich membrane protein [Clostridia bacterium]
MTNLIATVLLLAIVGGAVAYIIRAKKNGAKCIGCPAGGNCPHSQKADGCGCGGGKA